MRSSSVPVLVTTCVAALVLAACGGAESERAAADAVPLPATLFAAAVPGDARPLVDVKSSAKAGDRVTFEVRVGGRRDPFVENRAVFFVADASLVSCDQMEGDTCKTPWDYCCEPADNLLKHMATVRVVDDGGEPLRVSLENAHGLAGLRTVVVTGVVEQRDDAGNFVVDAETIAVKGG